VNTPSYEQVKTAISFNGEIGEGKIFLPMWDSARRVGVGVNSEGYAVLVLGNGSVGNNRKGERFFFWSSCDLDIVEFGAVDDVALLAVTNGEPDDFDYIEALSAIFRTLIELTQEEGVDVVRVVLEITSLFENRFKTEISAQELSGVVGELLVILRSSDPDRLVRCWHTDDLAYFDFSTQGERIEVKTTVTNLRSHNFSSNQIPGPSGCEISVASVLLSLVEIGESVSELVAKIRSAFNDPQSEAVLIEKLLPRLRAPIESFGEPRFDIEASLRSIVIFAASEVPRPTRTPGVRSMNWVADLSENPISPISGNLALSLAR